jgi:DNA-binding LytR/AlgR family response regulator
MYKILIIEDEEDIRDTILELFEQSGDETHFATNGADGVQIAADLLPDIILCDIMMSGLDGFEVRKKLRENSKTQIIPFIFLTARTDIESFREGMNLGADDFVVKPVRNKDLLRIVYDRLQRIHDFRAPDSGENTSSRLTIEDKILLNIGKDHLIVPVKDILFIEVLGNYTIVNMIDQQKAFQKKSLKSWEELLPEKDFIRVHHKTIINFNYATHIEPSFNGSVIIKLKNYPDSIICSKRCSQRIKKILNI